MLARWSTASLLLQETQPRNYWQYNVINHRLSMQKLFSFYIFQTILTGVKAMLAPHPWWVCEVWGVLEGDRVWTAETWSHQLQVCLYSWRILHSRLDTATRRTLAITPSNTFILHTALHTAENTVGSCSYCGNQAPPTYKNWWGHDEETNMLSESC